KEPAGRRRRLRQERERIAPDVVDVDAEFGELGSAPEELPRDLTVAPPAEATVHRVVVEERRPQTKAGRVAQGGTHGARSYLSATATEAPIPTPLHLE